MSREQRFWKRNNLWTVLLLAAVLIFSLFSGPGLSVVPGASELKLTMHDGNTTVISYDSITDVELLEQPDYGTKLAGKEDNRGKSGSWEHSEWGVYTLCVYSSSDSAVRIVAGDLSYVVSLGSSDETAQLYGIILEKSTVG